MVEMKCSFCGRKKEEVKELHVGVEANICIDCVDVVKDYIEYDFNSLKENLEGLKKPYEILNELNSHIIGQERAKKLISVAVYNHFKRIKIDTPVEIDKTNILMVGPTGSGKTHLMRTVAKIIDVPMVLVDATSLTEAGYAGEDVESVILRLLKEADMDVSKAEQGIIYVDEIDKIAKRGTESSTSSRDVAGEGVQQALLKMLEGTDIEVTVPGSNAFAKERVKVNTKNILFVCGGAFVGIDRIIKERNSKKMTLGFSTKEVEEKEEKNGIIMEDLVKFGMIEEFLGRLPIVVSLDKLNKELLKRVLIEPKNAVLKQYKELFKIDGIDVEFDDDAIDYIAEIAENRKMGARGLRNVVEEYIYDLIFEMTKEGNKKRIISKEDLKKHVNR